MKPKLKLDGANGVGADRVKSLMSHIGDIVDIQVYNDGTTGKLNYMVCVLSLTHSYIQYNMYTGLLLRVTYIKHIVLFITITKRMDVSKAVTVLYFHIVHVYYISIILSLNDPHIGLII